MPTYSVTIARSVDEARAFHAFWADRVGDSIVADPGYFAVAVESDPHAVRPHVLYVERDGTPHAVVVARVETFATSAKLGHRRLFSRPVRSITTMYGGCLGVDDEETACVVLDELRRCLRAREADLVTFRHLAPGSALFRVATTKPSLLVRQHGVVPDLHWELELPTSYDEYLRSRSKKIRDGIKSYGRRFEREFGERIAIRTYRHPDDLDELFAQISVLSPKTYQHGLGVALADNSRHRPQVAYRMAQGWYRAWVLTVDGEPVAIRQGDLYRGRFRSLFPGYDATFARYRVGNYLLARVIAELCADPTAAVVDFGLGDSESKRHFGTASYPERDVVVYAPTATAIGINAARGLLVPVNRLGKGLLRRAGLYDRLRRRSRARALASRSAADQLAAGG